MGRGQKSTLIGDWKKLVPTLMDDFGGLRLRGECNCLCGGDSKITTIRSGA